MAEEASRRYDNSGISNDHELSIVNVRGWRLKINQDCKLCHKALITPQAGELQCIMWPDACSHMFHEKCIAAYTELNPTNSVDCEHDDGMPGVRLTCPACNMASMLNWKSVDSKWLGPGKLHPEVLAHINRFSNK